MTYFYRFRRKFLALLKTVILGKEMRILLLNTVNI